VYHTVVFGGPLTVGYDSSPDGAREGGMVLGITLPSLRVLGKVLFAGNRGLLHHFPWLALALPGAIALTASRARRAEGLSLLGLMAASLWFNSSLTSTPGDWMGGTGVGTRHLVPYLPFYVLALAGLAAPLRQWVRSPAVRAAAVAVFVCFVAVSSARMLVATAVRPEAPNVDDPFGDYLTPLWRAGQVGVNPLPMHNGPTRDEPQAWNLGQKMGLEGRASLLPLGLFATLAAIWLAWSLRAKSNGVDPAVWFGRDRTPLSGS
jgi:hypothetical protein